MFKTIIAVTAFVTSLILTANANATWTYYDELNCNLDVESWLFAEQNDTDGIYGPYDADRLVTITETSTLDRVDIRSKYNIISISIPMYFYNLIDQISPVVMFVTFIAPHATNWEYDIYEMVPVTITGGASLEDIELYTIGKVLDSGVGQAPNPIGYRDVTVLIEIVSPPGVQYLIDQVRVNSTATWSQAGNPECPH